MKKLFASLACAALLITALTGCGQKTGSTRTPEELTQLYSQAITESGDTKTALSLLSVRL